MSVCCRDFTELSPDRDEGGWTGKGMEEEGGEGLYIAGLMVLWACR